MKIHRIHIRPKGGKADPATSVAYCMRHNVIGVGWGIPESGPSLTWDQYLADAAEEHPGDPLASVRYIHDNVRPGDLVWSRDSRGEYLLARVSSPWHYHNLGSETIDADIFNTVGCTFQRVKPEAVPGKIIASFRPQKTIQPVANDAVVRYTIALWAQLTGEPLPEGVRVPGDLGSLFEFLDAETTEDLVLIYLQARGWLFIPSSRKSYTMAYEFVLKNREDGRSAVVQVKTGNTPADADRIIGIGDHAFLFQSNGVYRGSQDERIEFLDPDDVLAFALTNRHILPPTVTIWLDRISDADGRSATPPAADRQR